MQLYGWQCWADGSWKMAQRPLRWVAMHRYRGRSLYIRRYALARPRMAHIHGKRCLDTRAAREMRYEYQGKCECMVEQ